MKITPIDGEELQRLLRLPPLMIHEQLSPECERRLRATWEVLKGFYHVTSWERYEHMTCKNVNPESDIEFLEWIAERFQAYRNHHPKAGTFHLKRQLNKFVAEFFVTHPIMTMIGPNGVQEVWAAGSARPAA